jgi:hypothetical protein
MNAMSTLHSFFFRLNIPISNLSSFHNLHNHFKKNYPGQETDFEPRLLEDAERLRRSDSSSSIQQNPFIQQPV